jgi:hypothetical protein
MMGQQAPASCRSATNAEIREVAPPLEDNMPATSRKRMLACATVLFLDACPSPIAGSKSLPAGGAVTLVTYRGSRRWARRVVRRCRRSGVMRSWAAPAAAPVSPRRHVTSCATRVLTRLREAGIETTRVYLHLTNEWLAGEYRKASKRIDADRLAVTR